MIFKMLTMAGIPLAIFGLASIRRNLSALVAGICLIIIGAGTEHLLGAYQKDVSRQIQLLKKNKNAVLHCTDHRLLTSDQTLIVHNWELQGDQVIDKQHGKIWSVLACQIGGPHSDTQGRAK